MKRTIVTFSVVLVALMAGEAGAGPTFTFEWTGTVSDIQDGFFRPATMAGVNVGDSFVATVTYDTAGFGLGVDVVGNGLDYAAPPGLQMAYHFESGVVFVLVQRELDNYCSRASEYIPALTLAL